MQIQYNVLSYRTDLHFHDYNLATENGHSDRRIDYKIKREKKINKKLVVGLLELILIKKTLIFLKLSMKYLDILNNRLKNTNK